MATQVLQRTLDANSNRIANLGTPTTAGDATKTDNSTAPANPAAAASAGSSLLAAPADHVHQAVHSLHADANGNIYGDARLVSGSGITLTQSGQDITVATSGGLVNKWTVACDDQFYVTGTTEEIVQEYTINFDDVATGASNNIQGRLNAIVKVGAGTGTYRLRTGATAPGATTGSTIRATFTSTSTTEEIKTNQGSAFANPGGSVTVQITAVNDTAATKSYLRGFSLTFG